jgi:hypothetical protein
MVLIVRESRLFVRSLPVFPHRVGVGYLSQSRLAKRMFFNVSSAEYRVESGDSCGHWSAGRRRIRSGFQRTAATGRLK